VSTSTLPAELRDWAAGRGYEPREHNYGRHADQVADLMVPRGHDRFPVAILLHGGFWRQPFDRRLMDAMAISFVNRGWATWNVEYRRGPATGTSGTSVQDVRAAVSMLRLIPEPLDLKRVMIIGHSAGGHLALCAAPVSRAKLIVSLAGVADLVSAADEHLGNDAAVEWVGATPAQNPDAYAAANPIGALPSGVATLLVHGDADDRVPIAQSRSYLAAARQADDDCTLIELAGEGHFGLIDPRSPAFAAYFDGLVV
jgi:acetyl esterase/lipase